MSFIGLFIFVLIWHIASLSYNDFVLPGPFTTIVSLIELFQTPLFWSDFINTLSKTIYGLVLSVIIGIPLGLIIGINKKIYNLFRPMIMIIQSAPIISYIVIAMLWFGIGFYTPIFIAFLVLFPIVVLNISQGVISTDKKLLDMAKVYKVNFKNIVKYIYLPSLVPFLLSTLQIMSGTLWKSVVVGEFLAGSQGIGYSMSFAKSSLNTEKVFAYTIFLIFMGIIYEKVIMSFNIQPKIKIKKDFKNSKKIKIEPSKILLKNINKRFDDLIVLNNLNLSFEKSKTTVICGFSGIGKTTIIKIISQLLKPESGEIINSSNRISYIFQDERLIPWLNCNDNIKFVNPNVSEKEKISIFKLLRLDEKIKSYPYELSGGMAKRLNLARALLYYPDLLLMDEPFSSLDIRIKTEIIKDFIVIKNKYDFTVIMVSHDPYEISLLADNVIFLDNKPAEIIESMEYKEAKFRSQEENEKIYKEVKNIMINKNFNK